MTIQVNVMSYKYGHLVAHCIESLLAQTRKPDVIKVFDDGVGDCKHLKTIYPEIELIERSENLGIVKNFDDALKNHTHAEKVMFLGADNWLRPDALDLLSQVDADVVTYDIVVTGEYKDEITRRHPTQIEWNQGDYYWDRSEGHHGSMLYSVDFGKRAGYSSPPGRTVEDWVLYNKMLSLGAKRVHVPESLLFYRRHRDNFNSVK